MIALIGLLFCFYIFNRFHSKEVKRTRVDIYRLISIYIICLIVLSVSAYTFDPFVVALPIVVFVTLPIPFRDGNIIKEIIDASFITSLLIVFVFLDYVLYFENYIKYAQELIELFL